MKALCSLVAVLVTLCAPVVAFAWGFEGHRLITEVAEAQLTPEARSEVNRLLALEPGATLASISTWADENRSPSTASWHYVNLPRDSGCKYEAVRDCPDGHCVVSAIERQARVLASSATDADKLKALKYVVHFVGDVHQPLHAGYADDKGGNTYQVQAFGRGTNLHALWDSRLIESWPGGTQTLLAELKATPSRASNVGPAQWAEESCRIVAAEGFYPTGHKIDADYAKSAAPALKERLSSAGRRLAALLNEVLGAR
jgi:hypothetical protein